MSKARYLCQCAGIAAFYVVLTWFSTLFGLSSGVIQVRFSEALCILPVFIPAAVPGLTIGCLIANLLSGCVVIDVFVGAFATFLGAIGTYWLRKQKLLAFLPPILSNAFIVPWVLKLAYGIGDAYWLLVITVGLGEVISAGVLGFLLYRVLKKVNFKKF